MKRTDLLHHHTDDPCEECARHERESANLRRVGAMVAHAFNLAFLGAAIYWAWRSQWFTAWAILALAVFTQIERNTRLK